MIGSHILEENSIGFQSRKLRLLTIWDRWTRREDDANENEKTNNAKEPMYYFLIGFVLIHFSNNPVVSK